jgi:uncharacterized membrane protein
VKNRFAAMLFVCLALAGTGFSQINSPHFRYVAVNAPGATVTIPRGINNFGEIVGSYQISGNPACGLGVNCVIHGFKLINKKFTRVDVPGALQTEIHGVNDAGDVAGAYFTSDGRIHGFLLHHTGQLQRLDAPGAQFTVANGVNNALVVVGNGNTGFTWKNGRFSTFDITVPNNGESEDLLGISNNGFLAGTIFRQDFQNGFQKTGADLDVFARINGRDTHIVAVNSRDDLLGAAPSVDQSFVAFHEESNETTEKNEPLLHIAPIHFPGSTGTTAWGINFNQAIVGSYTDSSNHTHGFLAVH